VGSQIESIGGRYALQPKPISGGMADVYRGNDMLQGGLQVAVKVFRKAAQEPDYFVEAFRRETTALTDLKHPSIVELYGSGLDEARDQFFLILEWLDGGDPPNVSKRVHQTDGTPFIRRSENQFWRR